MHNVRKRSINSNSFNVAVKEVENGFIIETYTDKGPAVFVVQKENNDYNQIDKVLDICKHIYNTEREEEEVTLNKKIEVN